MTRPVMNYRRKIIHLMSDYIYQYIWRHIQSLAIRLFSLDLFVLVLALFRLWPKCKHTGLPYFARAKFICLMRPQWPSIFILTFVTSNPYLHPIALSASPILQTFFHSQTIWLGLSAANQNLAWACCFVIHTSGFAAWSDLCPMLNIACVDLMHNLS